jgi:hypothetical protein
MAAIELIEGPQTGDLNLLATERRSSGSSKRQNTVEASTFGSEFQALKNAVELIESLRYKLRMFGVPIDGPSYVFCDNEAVYKNSSLPESTLKKKHQLGLPIIDVARQSQPVLCASRKREQGQTFPIYSPSYCRSLDVKNF